MISALQKWVWWALRLSLCAAMTLGGTALAAPSDADGVNMDTHPGPSVWVEEHWDVKPDQLRAFVDAYDKEIYALARRTPGYRGYTIATSLPAEAGDDQPNTPLGGPATVIRGHPAIQLMGRIRTNKSVNWDAMFGHAFNVLIIHNIKDWADADRFRERMGALYTAAHPGQTLGDRLAQTVFPLANNYWDSDYRLIKTGWPQVAPPPGARAADDADGLNLEPRKGPTVLVYEHWDVKPERLRQFLASYQDDVYSVIRRTRGYRGYSIATTLPPQPWEKVAPLPASARAEIGGDDRLYVPRPGVMMDGAVRTDTSINIGAVYKKTFNVMVVHEMKDWDSSKGWYNVFSKLYASEHNGGVFTEVWATNLMPNANNHWDTFYRVIKTSATLTDH